MRESKRTGLRTAKIRTRKLMVDTRNRKLTIQTEDRDH